MVDRMLASAALGCFGLARKAGAIVLGAGKVESLPSERGRCAVLHAFEAADDGVRKILQARRAIVYVGGPEIPAFIFSKAELDLALGGVNVIHAAVLAQDAGKAALQRIAALDRYRDGPRMIRRHLRRLPTTNRPQRIRNERYKDR